MHKNEPTNKDNWYWSEARTLLTTTGQKTALYLEGVWDCMDKQSL